MSSSSQQQPAFRGFLKASGQAEVWDDSDEKKFQQFGWRTGTNESAFSSTTLNGNWNEERFDVSKMAERKSLPSQYSHYFDTTYKKDYCGRCQVKLPDALKLTSEPGDVSRAFPAHQPELDPPEVREYYTTYLTTSSETYSHHSRPKHITTGTGSANGEPPNPDSTTTQDKT